MDNIQDIYELSPVQEGMLFHTLYASESGVYFEQVSCTLNGNLQIPAFKQAWEKILARHSILRTAFYWEETDKPLQVVYKQLELPWFEYNWSDSLPVIQQEKLGFFLQSDLQQGFQLECPPLMRCTLIKMTEDSYQFIWSYHHLLLDGWCLPIILKEVFTFYESFQKNHYLSLTPPRPYKDYIAWLQQQSLEEAKTFWQKALHGFTAPTPLVFGKATSNYEQIYHEIKLTLPAKLASALQSLVRQHRLTLNSLIQGVWALLLSRYSGDNDVCFGTTVSGRPTALSGVESMVGLFINTLPVRVNVPKNTSLLSWLQHLQGQQVEREQYSYTQLTEIQGWSEVPRGTPLFESIVVFEKYPLDSSLFEHRSLEVGKVEVFERNNFPLTVLVIPSQDSLSLQISYDRSRFDTNLISRIFGHFQTVIESIVANPQQQVSQLPLLTQAEQDQLLVDWNDTQTEYPHLDCVHKLFEAQVERTPDAVAVVWEEECLTYRQLNARANQLARYLQTLGVGAEVLVGISLERSLSMIVGMLGILKAGGAYVPFDPSYPFERLCFMLEDVQPPVLLTQEKLLDELPSHWGQVVCLDSDWEAISQESQENLPCQVSADNLAYVVYTSGSTGKPKGVAVTHQAINRLLFNTNYIQLQPDDRVAQVSNSAFDAATFEIWGALLHGARLVGITKDISLSPHEFAARIRKEKISTMFLTTALFNQLANVVPDVFKDVKHLLFGGEAVDPNSVKEILGNAPPQRLLHVYGPTESTTFSSWFLVEAVPEGATNLPIGYPISNTQIYILDQSVKPVPVGVWGELHISGAGLARGYLNRPSATAEKFIPNPFGSEAGTRLYKTGDFARYLPDGSIEFLGRIDNQVKIRGFRIELGEIEALLTTHPYISKTTVIVREDKPGEKLLVAYMVPNQKSPTTSELRHFLKEKLPEYMLPAAFVLLDSLPLTPNGKVDHRQLPTPDGERPNLESNFVAPRTWEEKVLAGIWGEVLGIEKVGIHDNYFELGGDSIRSIKILSKAKENGLDFSLQQIFQHQRISELVSLVNQNSSVFVRNTEAFSLISNEERLKLPADVEDAYPLTALQAGMVFHSEYSPDTAVYHDVLSYHVKTPLNLEVLQETIQKLVNRHAVMRTSFALIGFSEPLQLVHRNIDVSLPVEDLQYLSTDAQEAAIDAWIASEKVHPFDWTAPPMIRFLIHRRSPETFNLSLSFHHSIFDGWSLATLVSELFGLYLSKLNSQVPTPIEAPVITYRDFVALERQAIASQECKQHWVEKLDDINITRLPRWQKSSHSPQGKSTVKDVAISAEISDGLKKLALIAGVPLKSVLLASHLRALSLLTNQEDVVTGVVSNGRSEETDGERVLGLFLNTLPFPSHLSGGSWIDLVQATFKAEQESLPFRRYPLIELQKHFGGQSLFDTTFNFVHFHVYQNVSQIKGAEFLGAKIFEQTNFTLTADFSLDVFSTQVQLSLKCDTNELCEEQLNSIGNYYAAILAAMANQPTQRYEYHSVLSPVEQKQLLWEWNDNTVDFPTDKCIHQLFEAQVEKTPDTVAVVCKDQYLTYKELNARANQLARYLETLGVGAEVLVGIYLERSFEMAIAMLGILKAGGAYVPLDPQYPTERLSDMLDDSLLGVLITLQNYRAALPEYRADVVCLDTEWENISQNDTENLENCATPENLAYLIYTSGSTGKPKGVMIEHQSLVNFTQAAVAEYKIESQDRILQFASISFDAACEEIFPCLVQGATLVLRTDEMLASVPEFLEKCHEWSITVLDLPTAFWHQLTTELSTSELILPPSLRLVIIGGEKALPDKLLVWQQLKSQICLVNSYGPTETTVVATICDLAEVEGEVPIGKAIPNMQTYVLDARLQPVPIGVPGSLYIGGVGVARGYLHQSELTASAFIPNPFSQKPGAKLYKTGDLARYLPDGNIEFLGRSDNQVKIRGYRIETGDIEAVLSQCPEVENAVVTVREEQPGNKRLVAYVVGKQNGTTLRQFLQQKLPAYAIPNTFVMLEAIPLTLSGKLDHRALPAPDTSRNGIEIDFVPPCTPTEKVLASIWTEVLEIEKVGIDDNFFELGGHSLRATQLISRIREAFDIELPLRNLFEVPTISGLAASIDLHLTTDEREEGEI